MKLTAFQKRCLESYVYLRGKPPSVSRVLSFRPRGWLPFVGIAVVSVLSYFASPPVGLFMIGLTVGAVLRIVANARFVAMGWPAIERVVDWDRLDGLLQENAQPGRSTE